MPHTEMHLLSFCAFAREKKLSIKKLSLDEFTKKTVEDFLSWLETERGCCIATRNQRLAALHTFMSFVGIETPQHLYNSQQILSIPSKHKSETPINFLTLDVLKLLLTQPDPSRTAGLRDLVLLTVLYDTGARVQELVDLTVSDVRITDSVSITLTGKGNKSRIVPVLSATSKMLTDFISLQGFDNPAYGQYPLFVNRQRKKLTRAGVTYILQKYFEMAKQSTSAIFPEKISPHCLRHSKAMHLLQSGVNILYIRDLLGYIYLKTTEGYARADEETKKIALQTAYPSPAPELNPSWQKDPDLMVWLKSLAH